MNLGYVILKYTPICESFHLNYTAI